WYLMDIGIRQYQIVGQNGNYTFGASIDDLGDLHNFYGYHEYTGETEVKAIPGKVYPKVVASLKKLNKMNPEDLFAEGYTYFRLKRLPEDKEVRNWPIFLMDQNTFPDPSINIGNNPVLFLEEAGKKKHVVINGEMISLDKAIQRFRK
ncbi:MAG: hypothetical protein KDD99_29720, partial [Bacteroidetes bacterium]|nr:hypothetical protein [Bacteroidota bacterium]